MRRSTWSGLRQYSSPYCNPISGTNCPADGIPVFSSIFAQDVVANSNYNSLQASLEKRFSNGVQFLGAYTWSKSIDNASSFEQSLDPTDFSRSRALSLYGATNRFVFSGVWDLPFKKYSGALGVVADGWTVSAIVAFQDGFPIRMQSNLDQELQGSGDFENPGKPDHVAPFTHQDPRKNNGYYFNPEYLCCGSVGQPWIGDAQPVLRAGHRQHRSCLRKRSRRLARPRAWSSPSRPSTSSTTPNS